MADIDQDTWDRLLDEAHAAADNAYAPYSDFQVGAALRTADGTIHSGCNVENATFGATVCAERNAVGAAVTDGHTEFDALVIITPADHPVAPCGICRQVLVEFGDDLPILIANFDGDTELVQLADLLPHRFSDADF